MIVYSFDQYGIYTGSSEIEGPGWNAFSTPVSPLPIPDNCYAKWNFKDAWTYSAGAPPVYPSQWQLAQETKAKATELLYATDWAALPDVINPLNTPHLLNQDEFLVYRNTLRSIAINPSADVVFPEEPKTNWQW